MTKTERTTDPTPQSWQEAEQNDQGQQSTERPTATAHDWSTAEQDDRKREARR